MKNLEIVLSDRLIKQLKERASALEVDVAQFLSQAIEQNADKLIRPKAWMPREEWEARVRGDRCPDCAHLASGVNPHGYVVADLQVSRLDLMHNQFVPGFCILYAHRHVVELYELPLKERTLYFEDLVGAAQAVARAFSPAKMNYQILGNRGPHLHCILQPRFYGDAEPGWPIDPYKEQVILPAREYDERVERIRAALPV